MLVIGVVCLIQFELAALPVLAAVSRAAQTLQYLSPSRLLSQYPCELCSTKIAELETARQAAEEKAAVLEAHLAQLIAQAQQAQEKNTHSQAGEVQALLVSLEAERSHGSSQAKQLQEAEHQLDRLGSELLNVRAAAREQVSCERWKGTCNPETQSCRDSFVLAPDSICLRDGRGSLVGRQGV